MKFNTFFIVAVLVTISSKITNAVPMGDVDDERDVNFLINKIKEAITNESPKVTPQVDTSLSEKILEKSDEKNVIRFDSKGDSIEMEKNKIQRAGGCMAKSEHEEKNETPTKLTNIEKDSKNATESLKDNLHDKSSSVDDHAIRYDKHGNTFEEYKDSEEHHNDQSSEDKPKKKKKKSKPIAAINDDDDTVNLNSILNEEFINKQIEKKKQQDDDDSEMDEDDDIPLITIPMYDILRQFQRMQQGFVSETEEYSEETTQDVFADPHLKNILKEISEERKALKNVKVDGKTIKPAAKRVFERHFGPSDESL